MQIRKLSWAGVSVAVESQQLLIDPVEDVSRFEALLGAPRWPVVSIDCTGSVRDALVTHRHLDHFDPVLLKRFVGDPGHVYCPAGMVQDLQQAGLNGVAVRPWETVCVGSLDVTAVPAVDWRGDDQISWVIEYEERRLFHGGDTIWHGSWWSIQKRFGRFDAALLPVNGVVAQFPGYEPSFLPATLTPEQAVTAARLLHADCLIPMHYGQYNNPPIYAEQQDIESRLKESAKAQQVQLQFIPDGGSILEWP